MLVNVYDNSLGLKLASLPETPAFASAYGYQIAARSVTGGYSRMETVWDAGPIAHRAQRLLIVHG